MTSALKSFRLIPRRVPVTRFATDYPPEERARLREAFKPVAERHRVRVRIARIVIAVGIMIVLVAFLVPKTAIGISLGVGGFFICWFALLVFIGYAPGLACPGCSNDVDSGIGPYCPECGSRSVQAGTRFQASECTACGRSLWRARGRSYKIRACTFCGVVLDERGV